MGKTQFLIELCFLCVGKNNFFILNKNVLIANTLQFYTYSR